METTSLLQTQYVITLRTKLVNERYFTNVPNVNAHVKVKTYANSSTKLKLQFRLKTLHFVQKKETMIYMQELT